MKILNNIPSSTIISLDIETSRIAEHFDELNDGFKSAWAYKNKQDGKIPTEQELSDLWERTSSLYPEFSQICAISLSFLHNGKLFCKEFYGKNEKKLLEMVGATLDNIYVRGVNEKITYRLLGHASKYFDYSFMCKRYVINQLDIPTILDTSHLKVWDQLNLDSNELYRMGGTGPGSSLQALCNVLDVPISKVDLVGDEVGTCFYKGEYARIGRYCSYDTVATYNVFRRFKKEPIFKFDEVEYKSYSADDETPVEKAEKLPLLERLFRNGYLSDEIKKELDEKFAKKKLTKKDKENIKTILLAVYINTTHMSSDSKEIVERKENEIEEFMKNL